MANYYIHRVFNILCVETNKHGFSEKKSKMGTS